MSLKTFIRWSGNKSKHIRHILPYIPEEYNTYIEPFVGSGAVFLNLEPEKWIINDLNKDLINVWEGVKDDPEYIIEEFKRFGKKFKPMNKDRKIDYCKGKTEYMDKMSYNIHRAILYMLMNYSVYNGNLIVNNKLCFRGLDLYIYIHNRYTFLGDIVQNNILNVSDYLNDTQGSIYNTDYKKILNKAKRGDFVFLDPPYIEDEYQFNYNQGEKLDNKFINQLLVEVRKLDKKGVKWMMTQANTKEIKNTFKSYTIKKFSVYRVFKKKYVNELLIMNY